MLTHRRKPWLAAALLVACSSAPQSPAATVRPSPLSVSGNRYVLHAGDSFRISNSTVTFVKASLATCQVDSGDCRKGLPFVEASFSVTGAVTSAPTLRLAGRSTPFFALGNSIVTAVDYARFQIHTATQVPDTFTITVTAERFVELSSPLGHLRLSPALGVSIPTENLRLRFEDVADSRCPCDWSCLLDGGYSVHIEMKAANKPWTPVAITSSTVIDGYRLAQSKLFPACVTSGATLVPYVATLQVSKW